jgi:hypothetical protein
MVEVRKPIERAVQRAWGQAVFEQFEYHRAGGVARFMGRGWVDRRPERS